MKFLQTFIYKCMHRKMLSFLFGKELSGTAGSYSRCMFTFLRNYRMVFQSDSAMFYFYQQCNESSSCSISLPMIDQFSL